jgi:hypothetical protein
MTPGPRLARLLLLPALATVLVLVPGPAASQTSTSPTGPEGDRARIIYLIETIVGIQDELDELARDADSLADVASWGELRATQETAWRDLRAMVEEAAGPEAAEELPEELPIHDGAPDHIALGVAAELWADATLPADDLAEFIGEVDDALAGSTGDALRDLFLETGLRGLFDLDPDLHPADQAPPGAPRPERSELERRRDAADQAERDVEAAKAEVRRVQALPYRPKVPGGEAYTDAADIAAIEALVAAEDRKRQADKRLKEAEAEAAAAGNTAAPETSPEPPADQPDSTEPDQADDGAGSKPSDGGDGGEDGDKPTSQAAADPAAPADADEQATVEGWPVVEVFGLPAPRPDQPAGDEQTGDKQTGDEERGDEDEGTRWWEAFTAGPEPEPPNPCLPGATRVAATCGPLSWPEVLVTVPDPEPPAAGPPVPVDCPAALVLAFDGRPCEPAGGTTTDPVPEPVFGGGCPGFGTGSIWVMVTCRPPDDRPAVLGLDTATTPGPASWLVQAPWSAEPVCPVAVC